MFKSIISLIETDRPSIRQKTGNVLGFVLFLAIVITSCATTTNISSVWKDQLYQVKTQGAGGRCAAHHQDSEQGNSV